MTQPSVKNLWLISGLLLLLAACTPSPVVKPDGPAFDSEAARHAQQVYESGDPELAATLFADLGRRSDAPLRWEYLLRAAEAYREAGNLMAARGILAQIPPAALGANQQLRVRLLKAELLLAEARLEEALQLLADAPPAEAPLAQRQHFHRLNAEAFRLAGNLLEAAYELQLLDELLVGEPEQRLENQLNIIRTLATLTDSALRLLQPSPPGMQGGWMELARLIKAHGQDPDAIQPLLQKWREQFPQHPAMQELLDGYFKKLGAQYRRANHVAVLLPESGPYAPAAAAIRDGLLAAWYQQPEGRRPALRFYDSSNAQDTWPLYSEALARGADMLIGPLQKSSVLQLARAGELEVPVLALNQVTLDAAPPANFFQYALNPEDEARQVAERAWLDGLRRPVMLTPSGSWGERVSRAFRQRWLSLGGEISEQQRYNPAEQDHGAAIQALLDVDRSKARRRALQSVLGERLEFEPRRREDADFIFVAARVGQARQIRPQLQFHHALGLPVYATSHVWQGYEEPDKDRDLNGILFPDIPWLLADEGGEVLSKTQLREYFDLHHSPYLRLYAMGIDAYGLLPHLARLQTSPQETLDGRSGNLYMDALNQLHRQLIWARMENGRPQVIGYAPRMDLTMSTEAEMMETAPVDELPPPSPADGPTPVITPAAPR